jgi:hypothetical protein
MQKVAATVMEIMYHDELKRVESKKLFYCGNLSCVTYCGVSRPPSVCWHNGLSYPVFGSRRSSLFSNVIF